MLTLYPHAVGYVGIEDNKKEAIHTLEKLCAHEERISIKVLKTKYPQGGEKDVDRSIDWKKTQFKDASS